MVKFKKKWQLIVWVLGAHDRSGVPGPITLAGDVKRRENYTGKRKFNGIQDYFSFIDQGRLVFTAKSGLSCPIPKANCHKPRLLSNLLMKMSIHEHESHQQRINKQQSGLLQCLGGPLIEHNLNEYFIVTSDKS